MEIVHHNYHKKTITVKMLTNKKAVINSVSQLFQLLVYKQYGSIICLLSNYYWKYLLKTKYAGSC